MFFRALKRVALADGAFKDKERALLEAAAAFYTVPIDLDQLGPVTVDEVAQGIASPEARERLLQAALLVALADGEASPSEWEVLDELRVALEVDNDNLKVFYELSLGHFRAARAEILRRTHAAELKDRYAAEGWLGVFDFMQDGHSAAPPEEATQADDQSLWRHRKLGLLPSGTLGRQTWQYCVENELAFVGETRGPKDDTRDFVCVVLGLGAGARDQLTLAGFLAGNTGEDPFGQLFLALLQFHAGVKVTPGAAPAKGLFSPSHVMAAVAAGKLITTDLLREWTPWDDVEQPVVAIRERLGLAPQGLSLPS